MPNTKKLASNRNAATGQNARTAPNPMPIFLPALAVMEDFIIQMKIFRRMNQFGRVIEKSEDRIPTHIRRIVLHQSCIHLKILRPKRVMRLALNAPPEDMKAKGIQKFLTYLTKIMILNIRLHGHPQNNRMREMIDKKRDVMLNHEAM